MAVGSSEFLWTPVEPGVDTIGVFGGGRMGSQFIDGFVAAGYDVVATDNDISVVNRLNQREGVTGVAEREDVVGLIGQGAVALLSIPHQRVPEELDALAEIMEPAEFSEGTLLPIAIDAGNTRYRVTRDNARRLSGRLGLVDAGTSGGASAMERGGFSIMAGGEDGPVHRVEPLLVAVTQEGGYGHVGGPGAGHYVKMWHNAAEYVNMAGDAEAFDQMGQSEEYPDLDLEQVAGVWQHGSIMESALVGFIQQIYAANPDLQGLSGRVAASGEGHWARESAQGPVPFLELALAVREATQAGEVNGASMIQEALRKAFGGHTEYLPKTS